jgi:hypothetical protein
VLVVVGAAVMISFAFACAGIIGIDDRLPDDVVEEAGTAFDRVVPDDGPPALPGACPGTSRCIVVPDGWTLAALSPNNRPGCSEGYGAPQDIVVTDSIGCTCKCTETSPGSCAVLNATTTFRDYPAAGCAASVATYALSALDGGCANVSLPTTPAVRVPPAPAQPPACAADAGPTPLKNGQECAVQGASCADGGTCAGALPDTQRLCIKRDGDVACPMGFDKKYFAGSSASSDTRKCGTCTCTPGAQCGSAALDLYLGADCTKSTVKVPANGSCTDTDGGVTYASYRYTGMAPVCQPSASALLDGGVTIETRRTLCCEQRN